MIVQMKKIKVLCFDRDRDEALARLQDIGVIHVEPVSKAEGQSIETARVQLEKARRAGSALDAHRDHYPHLLHHAPVEADVSKAPGIVSRVIEMLDRRQHLQEQCDHLKQERTRIAPFGHFNPLDIIELREQGVNVELFKVPR